MGTCERCGKVSPRPLSTYAGFLDPERGKDKALVCLQCHRLIDDSISGAGIRLNDASDELTQALASGMLKIVDALTRLIERGR